MASLALLPPELFDPIVRLTIPDTFESLATTCKAVHRACLPHIKEYNNYRRRFKHFLFDNEQDEVGYCATGPICHAIDLLGLIARHPIVASYIKTADFSNDALGYIEGSETGYEPPYLPENKDQILELLRSSPYLAAQGCDAALWLKEMDDELSAYADVFLLTLLPNVVDISPSERYMESDGEPLESMVDYIASCANNPPSPLQRSLSKLRRVRVESYLPEDSYENKHDASQLLPLLTINSVESFLGESLVAYEDNYTGRELGLRHERLSRSLRHVQLNNSLFGVASLRDFLAATDGLESFHLDWHVKYHDCGMDWNVGASLAYLQQFAGATLRELTLAGGNQCNELGSTLTNMRGFERLESLTLDHIMLLGAKTCAGEGETDDDMGEDDRPALPRLVDLLPKSLERFTVHSIAATGNESMDCVSKLLNFTSEERQDALPAWKEFKVGICKFWPMANEVTERLEDFGRDVFTGPRLVFQIL